ncbi:MAG: flippase [Ignavibacteriales bacterium]|nr:flippase [Ignavibacteriales bacterium]
MKKIFQIIGSNKVLFKNFTSLSLLQIANYLFPLITLPYLVRVLGPEKYGLVNFAAAFAMYFSIITDYGFNLSATQDISVNRKNPERTSQIFSAVITIKMILFFISAILFTIIISIFPIFKKDLLLFAITFVSVFGSGLFPIWFYQGIEKMSYILLINVISRTILTSLIFLFVKQESDYLLFAILNSITFVIVGIAGFVFAITKIKVKFFFPGKEILKQQLVDGWNLFLSTIWINLYTTSNVFVLGLFAPANIVGYFAAADKVRMAFQGILSPLTQSVFPHVNKMLSESYERFIGFNKKILKIGFGIGVLISLVIFIFAQPIVNIVLGNDYQSSVLVLRIIAWLPLIVILSNVLGIQTMIPLNKHKAFSMILFFAALINLIISFIIVPIYFEIGTSISLLVTEMFVTVSFYLFLKLNKIKII